MKKLLLVLLIGVQHVFAQNLSVTYYYYNPYLNSSVLPSYYPTSLPDGRINVVAPLSCNLGDIRFPGLNMQPVNISDPVYLSMSTYSSYTTAAHVDPDLTKATHNAVIANLEKEVANGLISKGCSGVARMSVSAAQKWLLTYCAVPETPPTLVACSIGVALKNAIVSGITQKVVKQGCTVTVKYVGKEIIEITLDTNTNLQKSTEEAKFWISYINSAGGMIWLMNRLNSQ